MKLAQISAFETTFFELIDERSLFDETKFTSLLQTYTPDQAELLLSQVELDVAFFRERDPASQHYTDAQILSVRRGMVALLAHRVFGAVQSALESDETLFAVEHWARRIQTLTGVEIHPQAQLGTAAIDHGHGTVIGATARLGERAFLYHGVTLGASGKVDTARNRHPQLGNDVFLGNNAQILGPSSIGDQVKIAAGAKVINAVLADGVRIGPGVVLQGVKVPDYMKVIEAAAGGYYVQPPEQERQWVALPRAEL